MSGAVVAGMILSVILAAAGYNLAKKKGRRPWLWAWFGFGIFFMPIIGIVSLIVLAFLPNLREKEVEAELGRALPTARLERLAKLGELHEKGALADDEFVVEKDWLLHHQYSEWGPDPSELERITELHDAGTLTDEEYVHEKERVLVHH